MTTRSTPLPSNGAKRASACVPESLLMPGVPAWVQLSKDETQWVLQQLQGLEENKKIAPIIGAWALDSPDMTVATAALTDVVVAGERYSQASGYQSTMAVVCRTTSR